jgi:hypothetical protein
MVGAQVGEVHKGPCIGCELYGYDMFCKF